MENLEHLVVETHGGAMCVCACININIDIYIYIQVILEYCAVQVAASVSLPRLRDGFESCC